MLCVWAHSIRLPYVTPSVPDGTGNSAQLCTNPPTSSWKNINNLKMALPKDKKNIVQRRHYEYKKKKEYKRKQSIWFRYSSATTYTIATWRMRTMAHIYRHDIYDLCVDMLYCFQTASVLVFIMTNATKRMPRFKGTVPPFLRPRSTTLKLLASRGAVQSFIHGMNNKSSKSGSKKKNNNLIRKKKEVGVDNSFSF